MGDTYLNLVNSGITKEIAKKLGLPRPSVLRRFDPSKPLVPGPVLVLGKGETADELSQLLLRPGDGVVVGQRSYPGADQAFAAQGARVYRVGVDQRERLRHVAPLRIRSPSGPPPGRQR